MMLRLNQRYNLSTNAIDLPLETRKTFSQNWFIRAAHGIHCGFFLGHVYIHSSIQTNERCDYFNLENKFISKFNVP